MILLWLTKTALEVGIVRRYQGGNQNP